MKLTHKKTQVLTFLALGLQLLVGSATNAAMHFPPKTDGKTDKFVNYLLYMQTVEIPGLLDMGAEYDVSVLDLLRAQEALVQNLSANPAYMAAAKKHPELVNISIGLNPEGAAPVAAPVKAKNSNDSIENQTRLFAAATKYLANTVEEDGFKSLNKLESYVRKRLGKYIQEAAKADPRLLLVGLIQCLPAKSKGEVFRLKPTEQLAFLEKSAELTDAAVKANFRPEGFGIAAKDVKVASLIKMVKEGFKAEAKIAARLLALSRVSNLLANGAHDAINLNPLDAPSDLETKFILDKNARTELVSALSREGSLGSLPEKTAGDYLERFTKTLIVKDEPAKKPEKKVAAPAAPSAAVESLVLKEVPPYVGIFRGFVGGDCSTQNSYSFAYAPNERTFFIMDARGNPRGYAQATLVNSNGKTPTLYVHDVVGPYLSPKNVHQVLNGLYQARESLGAEVMVLPTPERVEENINYESIHAVFSHYSKKGEAVALTYTDAPARELLAHAHAGWNIIAAYDSAAANPTGHLFKPDEKENSPLLVTVKEAAPEPFKPKAATKADSVMMALALGSADRSALAQAAISEVVAMAIGGQENGNDSREEAIDEILQSAQVDRGDFDALSAALSNPKKLPLQKYYQGLAEHFSEVGVQTDAKFFDQYPYLFAEGHLNASDLATAVQGPLGKRTVDLTLYILRRWNKPKPALKAIKENPALYSENVRFQNFMRRLLTDQEKDATLLTEIAAAGVDLSSLKPHVSLLDTLLIRGNAKVKLLAKALKTNIEKGARRVK